MDDSSFFKQIEFYSNVIVAFIAIQSITFCYNFGTNAYFNDVLRTHKALSISLAVAVFFVMFLALYANHFFGSKLQELSGEECRELIGTIYFGKAVAIVIFSALQICITVFFAVFSEVAIVAQ